MILYKYITKENLNFIFKNDHVSIKFTPFGDFNDPFESYGAPIEPYNENSLKHLTMRSELNNKLACLCLSRNPLSVLMWSHYADKHEGFVIGFDTENAGFEDESNFIITAKKGEMKYRNERDKRGIYVTPERIYNEDVSRALLLNKSLHWAYEDEVRVIKRTDLLNSENGHLIHKVENKASVKELYVGMRNNNFEKILSGNAFLETLILNSDIKLYPSFRT